MASSPPQNPHYTVAWEQSGERREARLPLEATAWSGGSDNIRALGVLLHGYGDSAQHFIECARAFHVPGMLWVALDGCFGFGEGSPLAQGRLWFDLFDDPGPQLEASEARIAESVAALLQASGCSPSRVVYLGFSQGGCMALRVGLRQAARGPAPAAIVSLSGFLLGSHLIPPAADTARARLPIFLGHGTRDQVVLPLWQFEISGALGAKGYSNIACHRYPADHTLHPDEVKDTARFLGSLI